jgi:hypothetical protein
MLLIAPNMRAGLINMLLAGLGGNRCRVLARANLLFTLTNI